MTDVVCPPGFSERLDRALSQLVEGLSRTQARKSIAAGSVFVDGRRCRVASRVVHAGNRLRLDATPETPATALAILHEDAACIAVDKPAGMPSAPTRQAAAGTAFETLKEQLRARDGRGCELWLVHRLDQATSGVLLFARTKEAARRLDAAFRERLVAKEYVAWVEGTFAAEEGSIDAPLRAAGRKSVVDRQGQAAHTAWRVLRREADRTLVELRPTTGRMHQLRVHLQSIGHPILGDRLYGGRPAARLMLHASRLSFPQPQTGTVVEVQSGATL